MNKEIEDYIKPCPFCGSDVDSYKNDSEFIYPVNRARTAFNLSCLIIYGGCGAEMLGGSPEECIEQWNTRLDSSLFEDSMSWEEVYGEQKDKW